MTGGPIAVVGGGIMGASVAYHLGCRREDPVVVYERGELASATTFRATAMIGVSDPAPYDRMQRQGFRLYNEFFSSPRRDATYRQAGRLRIATSAEGAQELADVACGDAVADDSTGGGVGGTRDATRFTNSLVGYVPGDEVPGRFVVPPLATEQIEGALHRPQYGYVADDSRTLGPRELTMEFVERAREDGVRFEPETAVTDLDVDDGWLEGVELDGEKRVDTAAVVCAAGPWNPNLAAMAGIDLPIEHVLSPVFVLELPSPLSYELPMIKDHATGIGLHPKRRDRILVTTTAGADELDEGIDPSTAGDRAPAPLRDAAIERAEELVPMLADAELVDEWVGVGTSTPDGKPIVGWSEVEGLHLAGTRAGVQYAPAVGSIVARQIVDGDPTEYYEAVSIARLERHTDRWDGEPPAAE